MNYTNEQLDFLKKNSGLSRYELTTLFNIKFNLNKSVTAIAGTCKRNKFLRNKKDWYFKKGHIPVNKGKVGLQRGNNSSFKKGNIPHNYLPVGSECLTTKDQYLKVKVGEPNKWKLKHRLVWEAKNGPIPKGYCIIFLDGNRQNCDITNLKLISKAENVHFNKSGFSEYPSELKPTLRHISKLTVVINNHKKLSE